MTQTYAANFVHCVSSTRDRQELIPVELQDKLYAYMTGIANNLGFLIMAAGGTPNHVHLLIAVPPVLPLSQIVQKLKANSSRWLSEHGVNFEWQKGYGAFSVSPSMLTPVQSYIRNQKHHHQKRNFEEEFIILLKKSGIARDGKDASATRCRP